MEKNNKNLGKDELKRVLLMMKYDSNKTLSENIKSNNLINEESNNCPNSIDEASLKVKASRASDLFSYMTTEFVRMAYIRERAIEIYNIINELSKKNFYDSLTKTCENSLKRFKEEFETEYRSGGSFTVTDNLEEEFKDLINGYIGEQDKVAKKYLELSLKMLNENINKKVEPNPEVKTECPKGQFYNPTTKKCQTSNCGGCIPSLCPKGTKSVNGKCVKTSKYTACTGFPLKLYCVNSEIGKVQKCLGLKQDNALGPKTQQALKDEGIELPLTADGVKKACSPEQLTPKLTTIPTQQTSEPELKENYKVIKKKIRENLIETKENKKNLIVEESIIKNRFSVIVENRQLKTKKEKEKFYFDVLVEMKRLNDQGFKSKLITESFFDIISGFFGKSGSGILQTIKEYFGNWLIEKLGVDTKGWIGGTIVKTIGNLDIADIPKLTNCTFTTKLLSKSLAENAVSKLQTAAGLEGTLSNIMRNTLVETLEENSTFMVKIEEALGSVLCPLISNVSGKLEDAASAMKEKAIAK